MGLAHPACLWEFSTQSTVIHRTRKSHACAKASNTKRNARVPVAHRLQFSSLFYQAMLLLFFDLYPPPIPILLSPSLLPFSYTMCVFVANRLVIETTETYSMSVLGAYVIRNRELEKEEIKQSTSLTPDPLSG